ncbi:MAG: ATP-binding cassette domain-containing protein [Pseudomonadota bacterium]
MFSLRSVVKRYAAGGTEFRLTLPRLDIAAGSKLAFIGESGSGKSTLLELLAMILHPTEATRFHFAPDPGGDSHDVAAAWQARDRDQLADFRRRHIGYVLQHGGLLPYLTVRENINLSRRLLGRDTGEAAARWADSLNIGAQLDKLPAALSVGQRQRVAVARALAHEPAVLIADEPTAAVDPLNAARIMELMVGLVDDLGVTLIVASHAHRLMENAGLELIDHSIASAGDNAMHVTVNHAVH